MTTQSPGIDANNAADEAATNPDTEAYSRRLVASDKHSHEGATAVAAASGAALGATAGLMMGPVGAAVGAVVGAVVGTLVGVGLDDAEQLSSRRNQALDDGSVPLAPEVAGDMSPHAPLPTLPEIEREVG